MGPGSFYGFRQQSGMRDLMFAFPEVHGPSSPSSSRVSRVPSVLRKVASLRRTAVLSVALASFLPTSGCIFGPKKQARVFVPPPPKKIDPAALKPPAIAAAPDVAVQNPETPTLFTSIGFPSVEFQPPAPPPPPPRPPRVVTPAKATPPPVVPEPAPKIAQIFTPDQLRDYTRTLDDSLNRVERNLDTLSKRNLNAEQRDRIEQIRDFMKQARQAQEQDLITAVNLAIRADVLAKDLLDHSP